MELLLLFGMICIVLMTFPQPSVAAPEPDGRGDFSRFNSSKELVDYTCKKPRTSKYKPVCPFPMVPWGWGKHGDANATHPFADVILGDCSITIAESTGGVHTQRCVTWGLVLAIQSLYILSHFSRARKSRKSKKNNSTSEPSTWSNFFKDWNAREKVTFLLFLAIFFRASKCIDENLFSNRLPRSLYYCMYGFGDITSLSTSGILWGHKLDM